MDFPINLKLQKKIVLKHTVLYIHCIDLLMWSPIKLDFSFYDFSMIYYDFFKNSPKKFKPIVTVATRCYCSKTAVKNCPGGKIDGFRKFRG